MQDIIINIMNSYGYLGVFLLIAIENIFPPIPSEVILTFGGFMTTKSDMNILGVILAATAGSLVGAVALYIVGRVLSTERLARLCESRLGRFLRLKAADVTRAEGWFVRHGARTVFLCRFVPIVRSLISIPAGSSKMRLSIFLPLTALGTLIWNTVLVILGRLAGDAWEKINHYLDIYSWIAGAVLIGIAAVVGVIFFRKRFLRNREKQKDE